MYSTIPVFNTLREEILADDRYPPILTQIGGINFGGWENKLNLAGINFGGLEILATWE